jgi:hypothetical protein
LRCSDLSGWTGLGRKVSDAGYRERVEPWKKQTPEARRLSIMSYDGDELLGGTTTTLPIVGVYNEQGGVELRGGCDALKDLATLLLNTRGLSRWMLSVPSSQTPAPYGGFLSTVIVRLTGGALPMFRDGAVLHLEGSMNGLEFLAGEINFLCQPSETDAPARPHLHVEYYPGHSFLAPSDISMVFSIQDDVGLTTTLDS